MEMITRFGNLNRDRDIDIHYLVMLSNFTIPLIEAHHLYIPVNSSHNGNFEPYHILNCIIPNVAQILLIHISERCNL